MWSDFEKHGAVGRGQRTDAVGELNRQQQLPCPILGTRHGCIGHEIAGDGRDNRHPRLLIVDVAGHSHEIIGDATDHLRVKRMRHIQLSRSNAAAIELGANLGERTERTGNDGVAR
jgi:hypothetical protein